MREVGTGVPGQHGSIGRQFQQKDIEVAQRSRHIAQPFELGLEWGDEIGGQHAFELTQSRPGASTGDPEVVHEVGVDVVDGPSSVELHGGDEIEQNRP
jgi:hypothetical protein